MNRAMPKNGSVKALLSFIALMIIIIVMARASVYATANPIQITVEQAFTTNSVYAEDVFTYILRTFDKEAPMPPGSTAGGYTFTIAGNSVFNINSLSFGKEGVYHYEILQSYNVVKPGFTYDRRVYAIEVQVRKNLNTLIIVRHNDKKTDRIIFENSFSVAPTDPGLMVDPIVVKTVSGNPARDGGFRFTLTASSTSYPMPSGSASGVKTIGITGPGQSRFGTWSYNKAGIYYYTVREVNAGERGYTYDTAVYTITDRVTEEYGRLVLSRIVTNDMNKPVATLDFHNSYSPIGGILGGNPDRENPNTNLDNGDNPRGNPGGNPQDPDNPFANIWDDGNPGGNAPGSGSGGGNDGGSPTSGGKPGVTGPKTGDNTNTALYIILMIVGGILAAGALGYIIISGTSKKTKSLIRNTEAQGAFGHNQDISSSIPSLQYKA